MLLFETTHLNGDMVEENSLVERIYWLIRLRWIAVAGVLLTIFFVTRTVGIALPVIPLCVIGIFLGAYNLVFLLCLNFFTKKKYISSPTGNTAEEVEISDRNKFFIIINRIANSQISLDLLSLAGLVHFSGGVENPFSFYFVFHMIIASILLSRRAAFLQSTLAILLFLTMGTLEYLGPWSHYCLEAFIKYDLHDSPTYVLGMFFAFVSTLYITVYLTTSISDKLKMREKNLKEANLLLVQKDRIKSEYVLMVSHDIKEHLAAVQSNIEPVTEGITGPLNDKQINLLRRASDRTQKLLFFVKALLDLTRMKLSKDIQMEQFCFGDMLKEVIAGISPQAKHKNISINSVVEAAIENIKGHKIYLQQAISNILANSVKYTWDNGRVDIDIKDQGSSILIQIKDTGVGIPKNEISKVFDEFYRASNIKGIERKGTGLGLSISKQVVERHEGKIWVESEEGKGSAFFIVLPKE